MRKIPVALVENHDLTREGILTLWRVSEVEVVGMATNATGSRIHPPTLKGFLV